MLDKTAYLPLTSLSTIPPANPPAKMVDGRIFGRMSKSQKAALAVAVIKGAVTLRPTIRSIGAAIGVSPSYIEAASKLSPGQLRQLRAGYRTLQELTAPSARERFIEAAQELGLDEALAELVAAEAAA